jgi:hypothetical protein
MQITRNSLDASTGPSDWLTGFVCIDAIATPSGSSRLRASSSVHFTPGARTAWHPPHPNEQTIWVLEGAGLCQRRAGLIELIRSATVSPPTRRGPLARRRPEPRHYTHRQLDINHQGDPPPGAST